MPNTLKEKSQLFIQFQHNISNDWTMNTIHFHDYYEINIPVTSGHQLFINDRLYTAHPGDIFLFNNRDLHWNTVKKETPYERYLIFFDPEALAIYPNYHDRLLALFQGNSPQKGSVLHLEDNQWLELIQLLDHTLLQLADFYDQDSLYHQVRLADLLLLLTRFSISSSGPKNLEASRKTSSEISAIMNFLNLHLSDNLSLDSLANHFLMNRTALCNKFKRDTGYTINQYLTARRIMKAKLLLKEGLLVNQCANQVGYHKESHFIRVFKALTGITPKQYALGKKQ